MSKKVYQIVTERIIQKVEEAIENNDMLPWQKPWVYANAPRNYVSGKQYRGVNNLLLEGGEYITWTQICELKKQNPSIKLKKGCKKEMVVYFNFTEYDIEKTDSNGKTIIEQQKVPFLKYYNVYNINHVEGIKSKLKDITFEHNPIEQAQQIIDNYVTREKIHLSHEICDKACYSPLTDSITLPSISQYPVVEEFFSTTFHELAHSTAASHRFNRSIRNTYGDEQYSKEELIAEITSCLIMGHCGIQTPLTEKNSVAYLRGWLKTLQDNVTLIVSASSQAQKAADYILGNIESD